MPVTYIACSMLLKSLLSAGGQSGAGKSSHILRRLSLACPGAVAAPSTQGKCGTEAVRCCLLHLRVSKSVAKAILASYEVGYSVCWFVFAVAWILREACCMQELYSAVPVALAPVLGNPILLAAFGVDRTAPLQEQVLLSHPLVLGLGSSNPTLPSW